MPINDLPEPEGRILDALVSAGEQPAENRVWWIVLQRNPGGTFIDHDAGYVYSITGTDEQDVVNALLPYVDPTADVSVAPHGWAQTPEGLEEKYRAGRDSRRR